MKSHAQSGLLFKESELFGRGSSEREGYTLPASGVPDIDPANSIPEEYARNCLNGFPELSEPEVIRHFTRLSQWNFSVDTNMYPLGSCTMKHNPRINESVARLPGFSSLHPMEDDKNAQGMLKLMYDLQGWLSEITGLHSTTLQPAAGAHGEFTALLIIRAALEKRGDARTKVLLPDSSHGTNPASAVFCGYEAVTLKSGANGEIDLDDLDQLMDEQTAALMVTNPNTLGIFESNIEQIAKIVHVRGGFLYCDGANLSALMGKARFGDMGVDAAHMNLHKTFSTPHGGGGPGAGPVCVTEELAPYLPIPLITKQGDRYIRDYDRPDSVGRVHSFQGNVGVLVRAAAYILTMGAQGLARATESAVLNANYMQAKLKEHYHVPYPGKTLHEFVLSDKHQNKHDVSTLDIAKALIDRGFHPPTVYFPLIARGAIMIEPTETESKETLDDFCDAMIDIAEKAKTDPDSIHHAPRLTVRDRLDEATAARKPDLRCGLCG